MYCHMITKFSGMVDLLTDGAPQARFARQSSAIIYFFKPRTEMEIADFQFL